MNVSPTLEQLLAAGRAVDPRGDRVHFIFAWLYFLTVPLGAMPAGVMLGILGLFFLLRLWAVYRAVGRLLIGSGLVWVLFLSASWLLLSLLWSTDRAAGFDEAGALRAQLPLLLFLWPILSWQRIRWLVDAVAVGVVLSAFLQVGQWLGFEWCWRLGFSGGVVGRPPGFLHPSLTAVVALVAGGWALVEVLRGEPSGRRVRGLLVFIAATISILLTGSRGPWLATALAWPCIFVMTVWAGRSWGVGAWGNRVVLLLVVLLGIGGSGWLVRGAVSERVGRLADEMKIALHEGNYRTDVGARLMQVKIAVGLWEASPILGVGAGSYFQAGDALFRGGTSGVAAAESAGEGGRGRIPVRHHPHSALLYALAVTGLPGVVLYLFFWAFLGVVSLRVYQSAAGENVAAAVPGLVVGLFIAFAVDAQNLSMPGLALLMLVVSVVVWARIQERESRGEPRN